MKSRNFSLTIVAALVLPAFIVLGYNVYIDPFQILHKDFEKPYTILGGRGTDRYQHAGIINNFPVESIVVGNSHSANYLPSKFEKEMKVPNVYSLTMDGSTIAEQTIVARHALRTGNIKYVNWGVTGFGLARKPNQRNLKMILPDYLYDHSRLNDVRFFLTFDLRKYHEEKKIRREKIVAGCNAVKRELWEFDRATAWYWKNENVFDRPVFVANRILKKRKLGYSQPQLKKLKLIRSGFFTDEKGIRTEYQREILKRSKENILKNIIPEVKSHRNVKFDVSVHSLKFSDMFTRILQFGQESERF